LAREFARLIGNSEVKRAVVVNEKESAVLLASPGVQALAILPH
jgi:hypothetical protein